VSSLRDSLHFPALPGTDVPGYHIPPLAGLDFASVCSTVSPKSEFSRTLSKPSLLAPIPFDRNLHILKVQPPAHFVGWIEWTPRNEVNRLDGGLWEVNHGDEARSGSG
jgi:hypothetical protein